MLKNFVSLLAGHARDVPDRDAVLLVRSRDGTLATEGLSYADLDRAARRIACWLRRHCATGDRVLLLYPTGLDFVTVLIGCMYAGVVAVPAPIPSNQRQHGSRSGGIVRDAEAGMVLTDSRHQQLVTEFLAESGLQDIPCIATDTLELADGNDWTLPQIGNDTIVTLQYTSGSTSDPKGVMVTHGSLLHNVQLMARSFGADHRSRFCSWLPPYHDMGLMGMILAPLCIGAVTYLLSPTDFLRRPYLWLQLIQQQRITSTAAPNFAYDLCTRRLTDEQISRLDLSSLRFAANGAEPIDAGTVLRFTERFTPAGFDPKVLKPCYGMAEATLFVSGTPYDRFPILTKVDSQALQRKTFRPLEPDAQAPLLVSSGQVYGLDVRIVDPDSGIVLPDGRIGEIWVRGQSVTAGYWCKDTETERTFRAVTADGAPGFLRTGDLGVLYQGELYVTGRIKEVLVIHGRNLHPHDIERDVATVHEAFHGLTGSVCSVPAATEEVVVIQELRPRGQQRLDLPDLARKVRSELGERLGIRVSNVVFLRPGQVRKTTSGKVQRSLMRELFMADALDPLYEELNAETTRRYRPGEPVGDTP